MLNKFLCWIGKHEWQTYMILNIQWDYYTECRELKKCKHCGARYE